MAPGVSECLGSSQDCYALCVHYQARQIAPCLGPMVQVWLPGPTQVASCEGHPSWAHSHLRPTVPTRVLHVSSSLPALGIVIVIVIVIVSTVDVRDWYRCSRIDIKMNLSFSLHFRLEFYLFQYNQINSPLLGITRVSCRLLQLRPSRTHHSSSVWLSPLPPCVVVIVISTPYVPMVLMYGLSLVNGLNSYTIDLQVAWCIPIISALTREMEEAWLVSEGYEFKDSLCYLRPRPKRKKKNSSTWL